jgi:hypothetical protein
VIEEAEPVLRLVALCGLPVAFSVPWQRLPLTAPVPVADAIRDDVLVFIGTRTRWPAVTRGPPPSCRIRSPWPRSR